MTEEPMTIQCDNCGTFYSDLEEVCPYCGQLRPDLADADEREFVDYPPGDDQGDFLADDDYAAYPEDVPLDEEYPVDEAWLSGESYLAEGEQDWPQAYDDYDPAYAADEAYGYGPETEFDDEYGQLQPDYAAEEEFEAEEEAKPRRLTKRRLGLGCLSLFLCAGLFYGGIGLLGAYHGLQERYQLTQAEAEAHYQRGQEHLASSSYELAIAEFELALSLNPNLLAARQGLRDAQRAALAQPTPTSETRSAAAESILDQAEAQLTQENWAAAVETLAKVRELDPDYRAERVSELIYTANYQLGLQAVNPDQIEQAVQAFELALSERPDDPEVTVELAKALLYLDGKNAEMVDKEKAVEAFSQLYREDAAYLDVKERLLSAYEAWGDELFEASEWCDAEAQYIEASLIRPDDTLSAKIDLSTERCRATPQAGSPTAGPPARATPASGSSSSAAGLAAATPVLTATTTTAVPAAVAGGRIYFSAYNPYESRWEILAVPAGGGAPEFVVANGTMPAVSPNGQLLVYRSEAKDSEGFHIFDMTTAEDRRITILRQHVLPRWGGDNTQFLLVAQEPGSNRWQVQQGFADGKSDPIILVDGRTPDWSPDNRLIAYQGTDPAGNNPGIYLMPFGGGETTLLTIHESDRSPDFSPDGSQLAYMSTRDGDWDIYTVSTAGSAPRQITNGPSQEGLPVWSPDGSQIAYVSDAGGSWNIYVISASGGAPIKVTAWDSLNRADWLLSQISWGR